LTVMDLATPVLGSAAILPRGEGSGVQPGYPQFRQEVLTALRRIESEAPEHGIDREGAEHAAHALCVSMDEQVAESEWAGKAQWANETMNMALIQDPEGRLNFFSRLE